MVRWLWALSLLLAGGMAAADGLRLELRSDRVEWGKPLRAQLVYQGPRRTLDVDYAPWAPLLAVESGYQQQELDGQGRPLIRQSLRLYPRRLGRFQLPSLRLDDSYSAPTWVEVTPPRVDGHAITIEADYPAAVLWSGQSARVTVTLTTSDPEARLLADPAQAAGVRLIPLQSERRTLADGRVRHRLGWQLLSHRAGRGKVALPMLRYHLHGRDRRRFALPLLPLTVRALPEYIPPTTPVGRPHIGSRIVELDGQAFWQVAVTASTPLAAGLPGLSSQLGLLAGVEPLASHEERRDLGGYRARLLLRVPLPDWQWPTASPSLRLRYFDPHTGSLAALEHPLPAGWRQPLWFRLSLAALLAVALWFPLCRLWQGWRRYRRRQVLARAVAGAADPPALRRLLLDTGDGRNLEQWGADPAWGGLAGQAGELAARLNRACFRPGFEPDGSEWRQLRDQACQLARKAPFV